MAMAMLSSTLLFCYKMNSFAKPAHRFMVCRVVLSHGAATMPKLG